MNHQNENDSQNQQNQSVYTQDEAMQHTVNHHLDTTGLICPEPVMLLHKTIRQAKSGDVIEVLATDPATTRDIPNFCRHLGHQLLSNQTSTDNQSYRYLIRKKV